MNESFIPAAHYRFLTPVYEWFARPFIGRTWKFMAEEAARLAPAGGCVTDIGCGPGTVLRRIRELRPDLQLEGFDIDPEILTIAKRKSQTLNIAFELAPIERLPLPNQSRDIVMNNMVFHHLPLETKRATLIEVQRVLKPGGSFLLCDFSSPREDKISSSLFAFLAKRIEPEVAPQLEGQLFALAREAQADITTLGEFPGSIALHILTFPLNA